MKQKQTQKQIQKQDVIQLQMQKYSHFTMSTVLSTAENIVYRLLDEENKIQILFEGYKNIGFFNDNKLIFDGYNSYNSGKKKPLNSLINQFIFQIENYADDFNNFVKDFGGYVYPDNMQLEEIISIIKLWINIIKKLENGNNFLKYFKNLENIFLNNSIKSYENEVREQYKNNPRSGKADPKILQREYMNATNEIDMRTKNIYNQNIDLFGSYHNY